MSRGARVYFCGCAALIGFAFAYALPSYARLPNLFYDPMVRRWTVAITLGPIPMGYYGLCLWGANGAVATFAIAYLATSLVKTDPSARSFGLIAAWTLTALFIVVSYFTWNNWP